MKTTAKEGQEQLLNKVIVFNDNVGTHEIDFDTGMMARIKGINDDGHHVFVFIMDFSEFEEHNMTKMKANYYDSNGVACETWAQQPSYHTDLKKGSRVYLQFVDDRPGKEGELLELPFEIAPDEFQPLMPTLRETLDALERTLLALRQRNLGKPYACLDEVFAEANHVLKKGGRETIN